MGRSSGRAENTQGLANSRSHSLNISRLQFYSFAVRVAGYLLADAGIRMRKFAIARTQFNWWYLKCSVSPLESFIVSPLTIPSVAVYCLIFNFRTTVEEPVLWEDLYW